MADTFRGAPLSKVLTMSTLCSFALLSIAPALSPSYFALTSASQILAPRLQLYRLFTSALIPGPTFASVVIAYLVYNLRVIERQMGSPKFAAFLASSTLFAAAARAALVTVPLVSATGLASGPLHVVFGLLPLYFCAPRAPRCDGNARTRRPRISNSPRAALATHPLPFPASTVAVPTLQPHRFSLFSLRFSEKWFAYAPAVLVAFSEGPSTALPAAAGVLFGVLYAMTPLSTLRFPNVVSRFFARTVLPWIEAPGRTSAARSAAAAAAAAGAAGGDGAGRARAGSVPRGGGGAAAGVPAGGAAVDGRALEELVAMGFDRARAQAALIASGGDADIAVAALVD